MVAIGRDEKGEKFELQPFSNFLIKNSEDQRCIDPKPEDVFSLPHSNAFVDLDGDCMPDIFLQRTNINSQNNKRNYYEIYTQKLVTMNNQEVSKFCLIQTFDFLNSPDLGLSPPLVDFSDMNRDGMIDMVFYDQGKINVYYNMHKPV